MTHSQIVNTKSFLGEQSGCTALVATISKGVLTTANAGGSRAILLSQVKGGFEYKPVSVDHTIENLKEINRVETWGGVIEEKSEGDS